MYLYQLSCVGIHNAYQYAGPGELLGYCGRHSRRTHSQLRSRRFERRFPAAIVYTILGSQGGTPAKLHCAAKLALRRTGDCLLLFRRPLLQERFFQRRVETADASYTAGLGRERQNCAGARQHEKKLPLLQKVMLSPAHAHRSTTTIASSQRFASETVPVTRI